MEIKTGVVGMFLVCKKKLSLDLVINNGKIQSLFSKGLKCSKMCFAVINRKV